MNSIKTVGLAKKVPWQAGTTLIVAALAYYGVDLDPEVSAALGVVAGFVAGVGAPAAPVVPVPGKWGRDRESGQGLVELVIGVLLILILIVVLFRVL